MKKLILIPLACAASAAAFAQYSIDWWTWYDSGGVSTGGDYSISATIGQPEAGPMSGGDYSLMGGFWSVTLGPALEPPRLAVERATATSIIVSWPAPSAGWALEENTDLNTTHWVDVDQKPQEVGGRLQVVVTPSLSQASNFYRLRYRP